VEGIYMGLLEKLKNKLIGSLNVECETKIDQKIDEDIEVELVEAEEVGISMDGLNQKPITVNYESIEDES